MTKHLLKVEAFEVAKVKSLSQKLDQMFWAIVKFGLERRGFGQG
jgi:hypothetical protein